MILFLMGTLQALAQPAPKINSIFPEWLQRGGEVEVTFQGENLSGVQEVMFSGEPGLSGTVVRPATQAVNVDSAGDSFTVVPPTPDDKRVKVRIQVEAGRSVSPREARLASGTGVSNPVTLQVVDAPWVPEREPNNDREAAQRIELPAAIAGRIQVAADVDVFRFEARKGEQLVFDVHASRGGSPLDSSLALLDADGRELARSEDANLLDSLIRFEVPEDGEYFIELRDFQFRGGGGYKYHLMAGAIPYVDRIFPPGGRIGGEVKLSLTGDNLEGAESLTLRIAEDAKPGIEEFRALTEKGAANPVSFHVGVHEETMEQEPNDTREQAGALKWPVTVNGRMGSAGDVDRFKFAVIQGDGLVFEALANRLGSPLDVLLTLTDAQGTVLARNDDASGMDARLAHTFKDEGEHFIEVRDLLERGGEAFAYRLVIGPPGGPELTVRLLTDTPVLHQGGRVPVRVEVTRSGFGGAVEILGRDLPEGISTDGVMIPAELNAGWLFLEAEPGANPGHDRFELEARALVGGLTVKAPVLPLSNERPVKEAFVTVRESAPFSVRMLTLSARMEQNQSTEILVEATRRAGFDGEIKVMIEGYSEGKEPITKSFDVGAVTLKSGETLARLNARAKLDAETGTRPVFARAEATIHGQAASVYSEPIAVTVGEFPFALSSSLPRVTLTALPDGASSAAGEAEFSVKVTRRGWFTEDVTLALEGLPEGISATSTNLPRGQAEAAYRLKASEKAEPGKTHPVTIVGTANVNGRNYQLKGPTVSVIVNAPADLAEASGE